MRYNSRHEQGFSLLELLLTLGIVGVIAAFTFGIAQSTKNIGKVSKTKASMEKIVAAAKDYYLSHKDLPLPGNETTTFIVTDGRLHEGDIPVSSSNLNLEDKYIFDAWGQRLYYALVTLRPQFGSGSLPGEIDGIQFPEMTYIRGIQLEQSQTTVAAVIISSGPNQNRESLATGATFKFGHRSDGTPVSITTTGDDIIMAINLSKEALNISNLELQVLQSKVQAFDAIYAGVDNGGVSASTIDESGCVPQFVSAGLCPPQYFDIINDPNCGSFTLDYIKLGSYVSCAVSAGGLIPEERVREFLFALYSLPNKYRVDPWLVGYSWGDTLPSPPFYAYTTADPQYHSFFSLGPDSCTTKLGVATCPTNTDIDDIIP